MERFEHYHRPDLGDGRPERKPANGVDLDAVADKIGEAQRLSVAVGHRVWAADPHLFADVALRFLAD